MRLHLALLTFLIAISNFFFAAPGFAQVTLRPIVTGLDSPVYMVDPNDGSRRFFIVEKGGKIKILKNGSILPTPFLDISSSISTDGERGLLSMAFDPKFKTNKRFFVYYVTPNGYTNVTSYQVSRSNPDRADTRTAVVRLKFPRPFSNHVGGEILFGHDGLLYIGSGDGGSGGDPFGNGQKLSVLLGKILRIDVSGSRGYKIPKDNPFVKTRGARKEIYAYGLRNPWRFSFDRKGTRLFVGDVGQNTIEEVDIVTRGGNYGWNIMEGDICFLPQTGCNRSGLILPIATYGRDEGQSNTGGYFYRGTKVRKLAGNYLFGDFETGRLFTLTPQADRTWVRATLQETGLLISSFAEDRAGELYVIDYTGTIYRVE